MLLEVALEVLEVLLELLGLKQQTLFTSTGYLRPAPNPEKSSFGAPLEPLGSFDTAATRLQHFLPKLGFAEKGSHPGD